MSVFILEEDPKSYGEAMKSVDVVFWKEAIDSELESVMSNNTWELEDLPRAVSLSRANGSLKRN